ncbi:MAG: Holliday junction branch migration protein RuvA [Candidatus Dadabacteria bacterium]|nr:MAG: Holliday junction branch migration protein RuvA [Candidatus Dadabacteria bacterium]
MIAYLRGKVKYIYSRSVVLDVGGVGYEVFCSKNVLQSVAIGQEAELLVSTEVREDAIQLFGFKTAVEKQAFSLLKGVKGVGPSTALTIISTIESKELFKHIASNNISSLSSLKGIGRKRAERIIVELRDKVKELSEGAVLASPSLTFNSVADDAVNTLLALGFSRKEAVSAVEAALKARKEGDTSDVGEIAREALRYV